MTSKTLASINPKIQLPHTLRYSPNRCWPFQAPRSARTSANGWRPGWKPES